MAILRTACLAWSGNRKVSLQLPSPIFSTSSTCRRLTLERRHRASATSPATTTFLRTVPPNNFQARALVDLIEYFGWSFVVAVNSGDTYGREGIRNFISHFERQSTNDSRRRIAKESIEIPYPDASDNDYDIAARMLLQPYVSNATVIVLFGQTETAQRASRRHATQA